MKDGEDQEHGDSETLGAEALFRAHAAFVAGFMRRLGLEAADVDDAVQEVFLVAHRKGGYRPGAATPRSWLGAIAVRVAANARRARQRRRDRPDPDAIDLQVSAGTPSGTLEQRQALQRVQRALDTLDEEHRAVFVLYELEGEDCASIARALEVPTGTVYSRLHTARKRFVRAHTELSRRDVT